MSHAEGKVRLTASEALGSGVATLPPAEATAPLATTMDDAGSVIPSGHSLDTTHRPETLERGTSFDDKISTPPLSTDTISTLVSPIPPDPQVPNDEKALPPSASPALPFPPDLTRSRLIAIAAIVTFTLAMSAAGGSTLNIALPTIQTELDIRETDLQWITSAYNLTNGCFLLLSGRVADIYGRKLVFLCGIMWVGIWTLVGSFMHSGVGLIVSRAMAGCGAAMATPSAIGIIAANFRGQARSTAFAAFAAGAPVGGSVGLVLGGVFVEYVPYSWRAVLCIMAGICFVMAIAAFFVLPRDTLKVVDPRLDWPGAVLVTVGLVLLMFVISDGQNAPNGWRTGYIIAMLILGVLFIIGFFLWERHVVYKTTRPPLMRLQLWTRANGRLASVYFIGFVSWMGFVSLSYHATLFYQQVQQVGAIGAMLRFIPCPVSGILCNVLVAQLVSRVPTQLLVCTGVTATGIANVLMALSPADVVYWRLPFNAMWMTVMGADFLMATGSIFVATLALPDEQSVAGALNQTLVQLGGSFGLALTTVISASYQSRALSRGVEAIPALLEGIHAAFWLGAGFSFSAMIIGVVMLRGMGTIGKVKKDEKEDDSAEQGQGGGEREVRGDEKV